MDLRKGGSGLLAVLAVRPVMTGKPEVEACKR